MSEFLKIHEAKAGTKVKCDGGFTCISEGTVVELQEDVAGELFFPCSADRHYIDGQLDADDTLIGLIKIEE